MSALTFKFDNSPVNVIDRNGSLWFVAADVVRALHLSNTSVSLKALRPFDKDKIEINGKETNIISEGGMYLLTLRSQDALKEGTPAYRFSLWVTNEVLPAIRKQGRYECPAHAQLPPPTLSEQQAYAIMSEVAKRAKNCGAHYQTIYRALKARYQVTKYTHIPAASFDDAVAFIRSVDLTVPETQSSSKAVTPTKKKTYVVTENFIERQRTFVYHLRYLFREEIDRLIEVMRLMDSPHAAALYDAIHDLNLVGVEEDLARLGFPVQELNTYKHWSSRHIK